MQDLIEKKSSELVTPNIEEILIKQDLRSLNPAQRVDYVKKVCDSLGLNPLTKPFEFVEFDGKVILYATKDAANQLRSRYRISLKIVEQKLENDVIRVRVQASTPDGRVDEDFGALSILTKYGKANGQNLANLEMKCVTKAKRRVTLSICGLGFLDETEVLDIDEDSIRYPEFSVSDEPTEEFAPIDPIDNAIGPLYLIKKGKFRDLRVCEIEYEELQKYVDYCEQRFTKNPALKTKHDNEFLTSAKHFLVNYATWKAHPIAPPYRKVFNKETLKYDIIRDEKDLVQKSLPIKEDAPEIPKEILLEENERQKTIKEAISLCLAVHGRCTETTEKWLNNLSLDNLDAFIDEQQKILNSKKNPFTEIINDIKE